MEQINWPDGHLDLNSIPAPWRLVHLGQSSDGDWSMELTAPFLDGGWLCACAYRQPSALAAFQVALTYIEMQITELRGYEPGVYHINVGARAAPLPIPLSVEEL